MVMKRSPVADENVRLIIEHYRELTIVPHWGYSQCIAGVAKNLDLTPDLSSTQALADALGVEYHDALRMIEGPPVRLDGNELRGSVVVAMLEGVLAGRGVDWGSPQI